MKTTFIYSLSCPTTGIVKYIGKATKPDMRYIAHTRRPSSRPMKKWMSELNELGLLPVLSIIEECSMDSWEDRERWWIAHYRSINGESLMNVLDGGNGTHGWISVKKHTSESRAKISASLKGRIQPEAEKAKRTATRRTPESRAKQSAAIKGRKHNSEAIDKMKERWTDEARSKQSEHFNDPEVKARMIHASKSKWEDPDFRKKMIARRNSPEYKAKMSECLKAAFSRPEVKAKLSSRLLGHKHTPEAIENIRKAAQLRVDTKKSLMLAAMTV
jgi:hypothetical protein